MRHIWDLILWLIKHLLIGFELLTCSAPLIIRSLVNLLCHLPLNILGELLFLEPLSLHLLDFLEGAGGLELTSSVIVDEARFP